MNNEEEYYPDWLYRNLVEDDLPWEASCSLTFDQFHAKYTLHDSYWIGVVYNPGLGDSITLCLHWDPVWLPDELSPATPFVAYWPVLSIRIEGVTELSISREKGTDFVSADVGASESIVVNGSNVLTIDGDTVDVMIRYTGIVRFLAMDQNREVLPLKEPD